MEIGYGNNDEYPCHIVISSTGKLNSNLYEVPAYGVYQFSIQDVSKIDLYPWLNRTLSKLPNNAFILHDTEPLSSTINQVNTKPSNLQYQTIENYLMQESAKDCVINFLDVLKTAVKERIEAQPMLCKDCVKGHLFGQNKNTKCVHSNIAILFSGGLDSVVLAGLAAQTSNSPIDLINVAFQQVDGTYNVPDRRTGIITRLNTFRHPNRKQKNNSARLIFHGMIFHIIQSQFNKYP